MPTAAHLDESQPPASVPSFYRTESQVDDTWPPLTKFLLGQFGWWSVLYIALWTVGILQYSGMDLVVWIVLMTALVLFVNFAATLAFPVLELRGARGLVAGLKASWLQLEGGEAVIRDDLVVLTRVEERNSDKWRLSRLVLTDRRLVFVPAEFPWWYSPAAYLSSYGPGTPLIPPLLRPRSIALKDIERFWTWQPPFSAAPAAQVGEELVSFALRVEQGPWQTFETRENVEAHFNDVEAAWKAAKGQAVSGQ
jgi:hypothetical protein